MDSFNSIKASKVQDIFCKEKGTKLLDTFEQYRESRDFYITMEKSVCRESPLLDSIFGTDSENLISDKHTDLGIEYIFLTTYNE